MFILGWTGVGRNTHCQKYPWKSFLWMVSVNLEFPQQNTSNSVRFNTLQQLKCHWAIPKFQSLLRRGFAQEIKLILMRIDSLIESLTESQLFRGLSQKEVASFSPSGIVRQFRSMCKQMYFPPNIRCIHCQPVSITFARKRSEYCEMWLFFSIVITRKSRFSSWVAYW